MMRLPLIVAALLTMGAGFATADPAVGLWKTEPDRKNLTSLIRIAPCGAALCGVVAKAMDASGNAVSTPNVGKRLFWDLKPAGGGKYDGGTVFVPLLNVTAKATANLSGNALRVTGCKGLVCQGQTWRRVN